MIIDIQDELFEKILSIVKGSNSKLYDELQQIQPFNLNSLDILAKARTIKTERVKERIKSALIELLQTKEHPTRYKVHKQTSITYSTLKKYYDEIFDEVKSGR